MGLECTLVKNLRRDSPWTGFIHLCSVLALLVLIMLGGFLGNMFNSLEGWGGALQEAWSLGFGFDTVVTGSVLVGSLSLIGSLCRLILDPIARGY